MKKAFIFFVLFLGTIQISLGTTPPVIDGVYTSHITYQFDLKTGDWIVLENKTQELVINLDQNFVRIGDQTYAVSEKIKVKKLKKLKATEFTFRITNENGGAFLATLMIFDLQGLETKQKRQLYLSRGNTEYSYDLLK